MADASIRFGVVHTSPTKLKNASTLEQGKLYFAAGDSDGAVKQGVYGVVGITENGKLTGYDVAMFGTGAVADGTGYGLSEANFTTAEKNKLTNIATNANNYSHPALNTNASTAITETDEADFAFSTSNKTLKVITGGYRDASGHVSKLLYTDVTLPATAYSDTVYTHPFAGTPTQSLETTGGGTAVTPGTLTKIATVYDASFDASGHYKGKVAKDISINVAKQSTVDTATKVAQTFDISFGGADILSFNGSTNKTLAFKEGSNIDITNSNGTLTIATTGVPTTTEMNNAINTALSSALQYKGTVNDVSVLPTTGNKIGDVYVCSTLSSGKTYYETKRNDVSIRCESGDLFIWNGTYFDIVNGENQVSNENATLSIGGSKTIATVDGTDITVSLPSSGYYTHPVSTSGTTNVSSSDGGDFAFSTSNKTLQVLTGITRDASGHIGKAVYKDITLPATAYSDTVYTHPASISGTTTVDTSDGGDFAFSTSTKTLQVVTGAHRDASGHISKLIYKDVTLPNNAYLNDNTVYTHPSLGTTNTAVDTSALTAVTLNSGTTFTVVNNVYRDASGHIGKVSTTKYTMPASAFTDTKLTAATINVDSSVETPTAATVAVISNTKISLSGSNGTSVSGTATAVNVATAAGVATAKAEAIAAATIYWETL